MTEINYSNDSSSGYFRVMDANLDMSSCPLPRWDEFPYPEGIPEIFYNSKVDDWPIDSGGHLDLITYEAYWACFINCSRAITNNSMFQPVTCLSARNSYIYVSALHGACSMRLLGPSCGYLGMIPLDDQDFFAKKKRKMIGLL